MTNRKGSARVEKRFPCTHEGCNRAFTRQEHLQRHFQNHAGGDFTCDRCRAHFKRRDLLDRHVSRHEQKDAEGSALMTRKRSWKDENGNIVTKKPRVERESGSARDGSAPAVSSALLSPPLSFGTSDPTQADHFNFDVMDVSLEPLADDPVPVAQDDFWDLTNNVVGMEENGLFEDVFNPDTASSFNMPYTTMNNYNWLFNLDITSNNDFSLENMEFPQVQGDIHQQDIGNMGLSDSPLEPNLQPIPSHDADVSVSVGGQVLELRKLPQDHAHSSNEIPMANSSNTSNSSPCSISDRPASSRAGASTKATSLSSGQSQQKRSAPSPRNPLVQSNLERPMTLLSSNTKLPSLDALARSHILELVERVRPMAPDGKYVTADHSFLSSSSLQTYSDLFFTRFNATYPLIHLASFEPSKVDTLLLVSILLLGATYCEKDAHQIAVCIHDVLRPQIFAHSSFSAVPELWVLQTILLVECFGKSRAGQKQHDMSHLFHGLLINLIRRSDCQIVRPEMVADNNRDLEDDWKAWTEAEQKKRLALLCFMWDTQHAVLFCQSLCMSAFELRCTLPCDQSLWEADSAESWQKLRKTQNAPLLFLTVLKSYIRGQAPPAARKLNAVSRVILLHGLMSIAWDMNRRDQTSLGVVGNPVVGDWRNLVALAYDTWKADFDAYTMSVTQVLSPTSSVLSPADQHEARKGFAIYATANSALYHAAHVILFSDFLDLQIYAGARRLLGRSVGREDYTRSQRVVKKWVNENSQSASKAVWHASHIIKDAVLNLQDFDAAGLFIHPWCLYLATITIWSFHHAKPGRKPVRGSDDDEDEMIWDAQADMNALIGGMTSGTAEQITTSTSNRKMSTAGLTAVISKHLGKIRWAVVHDGMLVLNGLVPWRLIGQTEV